MLLGAACVTGSLAVDPGPPIRTRWPTIVQPWWFPGIYIVDGKEKIRGEERLARAIATVNKISARPAQELVRGTGDQGSRPSHRSIASKLWWMMRAGFETQTQQETRDSQAGQNPTQPSPTRMFTEQLAPLPTRCKPSGHRSCSLLVSSFYVPANGRWKINSW